MFIIVDKLNKKNRSNKKRTSLINNKDYSFAVHVSEWDYDLIQEVYEEMLENNLTVAGDSSNVAKRKRHMLGNIQEGDSIIFGKSNRFDVEIASRRRVFNNEEIAETTPVYTLDEDTIDTILEAIREFSKAKIKLSKKHPRNSVSTTLHDLNILENGKVVRNENKKKEEVTHRTIVSSNFIIVDGKVYSKNCTQNTIYKSAGMTIKIPGFCRNL